MRAERIGAGSAALGVALVVLACSPAPAAGQPVSRVFERANAAAARGDYGRAIRGYRRLLDAGVDDPDVHFNLGTAHARRGELGRAVLHFERVLKRRPDDEGAERSLAAAREALGRARADRGEDAVVDAGPPFPEVLVRGVSEPLLAWLVLALDILLFGLLAVRRWVRPEGARLALAVSAPIAGLLLLLAAAGLAIETGTLREGKPGIVLDSQAPLRDGPDPRAEQRGVGREGERVRILGRHGRFMRVQLRGEREGWMHASNVQAI